MLAIGGAYEEAVASLDIDEAHQAALASRDPETLVGLMNCRESMICMVWAPEQEPAKRKDDDKEGEETPQEEDSPAE